jgi:hypothetical protein
MNTIRMFIFGIGVLGVAFLLRLIAEYLSS